MMEQICGQVCSGNKRLAKKSQTSNPDVHYLQEEWAEKPLRMLIMLTFEADHKATVYRLNTTADAVMYERSEVI